MRNLLSKAQVALFFSFIGFLSLEASVTFYIEDQQVDETATEVVVPVKLNGWEDLAAFQFTLNWDPQVLEFKSVTTFHSLSFADAFPGFLAPPNGASVNTSSDLTDIGKITVAYSRALYGSDSTLADGETLMEVTFTVLEGSGASIMGSCHTVPVK